MTKTLVIAEKPSVAQDIVRALTPTAGKFEKHDEYFESEQYVVTSAVGHLVEIQAPEEFDVKRGKWSFANLPVIPPHFDLKPVDKTKTRLNAVVKQAKRKDVTQLINACDAGREGELIFRLIEQYAGGKSPLNKPVRRLWLQSMTPQAIRDGFESLRTEAQMQGLADAARSRSEADWLVGINGTRAMTAFNSRDGGFFLTTVGRVQTPTLSVVVEREEKIRKFVSRDYWEIHGAFQAEAGQYPGKWFDANFKKPPPGPDGVADPEMRADRVWTEREAIEIADAARGKPATVTEESKPTTSASPMLFDLTSLQREANGRFGFSAKTTLALAQSLYERHKALTYPRTDSRALPEDYLPVVKDTMKMLADSGMKHLAPFARQAVEGNYVKPNKRIFDNAKVSDHFAIIPTLQAPSGLSDAEQKLYDFVVRRFLSVFFPSAEFQVTTRISTVETNGKKYPFRSDGKVLVKPGWLAIWGKEAVSDDDEKDGKNLVVVKPGETVKTESADLKALKTRPPARYSEATLLGAMEGAGKTIDDDELREAMQEKGLGTPATRAATIEGLIAEKYMLREGRELIPTAKAFQLMTLLRGLGVEELSKPELTGEWEYKLAQMEKGALSRADFMREIAEMTEHIVKKAKEYDRDTVPGDYATLSTPCPNCGGVVKENYRRYTCTGKPGREPCGFSFGKITGRPHLRGGRGGSLAARQAHRPAGGLPLQGGLAVHGRDHPQVRRRGEQELEAGVRLRRRRRRVRRDRRLRRAGHAGPLPDLRRPCSSMASQLRLREVGADHCAADTQLHLQDRQDHPAAAGGARADGKAAGHRQDRPARQVRVDAHPPRLQGLPGLGQAEGQGELRIRAARRRQQVSAAQGPSARRASPAKKVAAKKPAAAKKAAGARRQPHPRRRARPGAGLKPSDALAAVIGAEPVARTEVIKKLWDYIKANGLQDATNKRAINADAKLQAGVRQAAGDDVRAGRHRRQAPELIASRASWPSRAACSTIPLPRSLRPMLSSDSRQ
jgi:DNA topoisomerase-3